jgi:hypothetical protein
VRKFGFIEARWTPPARTEVERALQKANVKGGVLALFRHDDPASRWSYAVYPPDRIDALATALESRGVALLYELDGLTVAISDQHDVRALGGKQLGVGGSGYLIVTAAEDAPESG